MDVKQCFVDQLKRHYQQIISGAYRAEARDGEAVEQIRSEARTREDAKSAIELSRRESALRKRREQARRELEALIRFASGGVARFRRDAKVDLGALVDVSIEGEEGAEERTLFILPVGAGAELEGPGGDGFVSVVTPASPLGRALQGCVVGDTVEVIVAGRDREWTIEDIG